MMITRLCHVNVADLMGCVVYHSKARSISLLSMLKLATPAKSKSFSIAVASSCSMVVAPCANIFSSPFGLNRECHAGDYFIAFVDIDGNNFVPTGSDVSDQATEFWQQEIEITVSVVTGYHWVPEFS